ncbi:MAG: DMT family transporter [Firmicutes bacterium]|nr:DMT family transporter [Bacillota bacterium]
MRHETTQHAMMQHTRDARQPAALAAILFTTVVWGLSFISTKTLLVAGLTPVQVAFARFVIASAIFLVVYTMQRGVRQAAGGRQRQRQRQRQMGFREDISTVPSAIASVKDGDGDGDGADSERELLCEQPACASAPGSWTRPGFVAPNTIQMLIGGILGVPVYFMLENGGLRLTSASTASLITGTVPVINALAVVVLLRSRVTALQWAGIAMSCAGVYAVAQADLASSLSGQAMLGNVLVFLSACAWVAYTMINKPLLHRYDNLALNTYQTVVGTLFLLPVALHDGLPVATWDLKVWLNILYLGAICSALAYILYLFALKHLGSTVVTSCLNLVPFFGVLGGAILLGEPLSWMKCLGGLLAIIGVYLVTIQNASPKALSPGTAAGGMASARRDTGPGCAGE